MKKELFNRCIEFGERLIKTLDLDPVYVMLVKSSMEEPQLKRWCFAYWYFYHSGVASWLSEAKTKKAYYNRMEKAIGTMPRGTERRHFRGEAAYNAVKDLRSMAPEVYVDIMIRQAETFQSTIKYAKTLPQCGPWIGFKIADMIDRVFKIPVDFSDCSLAIYKDPKKGAALVYTGDQNSPISKDELDKVITSMKKPLSKYYAPPLNDRKCNLPEMETVLCKYKSHHNKRYYVGKDIIEVGEHLSKIKTNTSELLLESLPRRVQ